MQAQGRVRGQQRRQGRTELPREAHGRRHAQLALGGVPQLVQLGLGVTRGGQHGGAALVKSGAGRRQAELAGGAVQQGDAHVPLERAHLLAHGRGAGLQLPGGAGEAALLDDGGQHGHAFQLVQHEDFLNSAGEFCRLIAAS